MNPLKHSTTWLVTELVLGALLVSGCSSSSNTESDASSPATENTVVVVDGNTDTTNTTGTTTGPTSGSTAGSSTGTTTGSSTSSSTGSTTGATTASTAGSTAGASTAGSTAGATTASTAGSTTGATTASTAGSTTGGSGDPLVDVPLDPVQASLELVSDKTFRISWQPSANAQFYRVLENPDGVSGFSPISGNLDPATQSYDHRVALYNRTNAQYLVQACNASSCADSNAQFVSSTLWNAIGYVKASNSDEGDWFGSAVSLSADGTTLAVAAYAEDSASPGIDGNQNDNSAPSSGAVYVFVRNAGSWQQQAYLKANNVEVQDLFGFDLSMSLSANGNTLVVGASGEQSDATGINADGNNNAAGRSGAAYVFTRSNSTWEQQAYIKASNTDEVDRFGDAVSLSGDGTTLAVGASTEDGGTTGINGNQTSNSAPDSGAVYLFEYSNGAWQQDAYIKASNAGAWKEFGSAVSLSADGTTLAVGSTRENSGATGIDGNQNDDSIPDSGAVYVFSRSAGNWQQQAYVKSSSPAPGDGFGNVVSLNANGNTLAVGANVENGAATGINGNQLNKTAAGAGAVYLYERSNDIWRQEAYIKASNTNRADRFGSAISLSADGDSLAVGAPNEDSLATGISSNQNDNTGDDTGAVYVFARSSDNWQQRAYIKASNTDNKDHFGTSVSLSADGDTLAIGATRESSAATGINGNQSDNSAVSSGAVYLY